MAGDARIPVALVRSEADGQAMVSWLAAEEIEAFVFGANGAALYGGVIGRIEVLVSTEDHPHAVDLLMRIQQGDRLVTCLSCGYDTAGLEKDEPCPECGAEATYRSRPFQIVPEGYGKGSQLSWLIIIGVVAMALAGILLSFLP